MAAKQEVDRDQETADKKETLFLRFRGLQPGIRRNPFYRKHLCEVVGETEIPPQLSSTQGFKVIPAN